MKKNKLAKTSKIVVALGLVFVCLGATGIFGLMLSGYVFHPDDVQPQIASFFLISSTIGIIGGVVIMYLILFKGGFEMKK